MGNPFHPKIRIFGLEGLRGIESKKIFGRSGRIYQLINETFKAKHIHIMIQISEIIIILQKFEFLG